MRRRMAFACAVLAMATVISGTGARFCAAPGFTTLQPSMLEAGQGRSHGDAAPDGRRWSSDSGYQFEAIPDGISVRPHRKPAGVELYVNHETSKVPFPYNPGHSRRAIPASRRTTSTTPRSAS